jgi:antitoxin MazE
MVTRVQRWGNSLGVRIPKTAAQGAHVKEGTAVRVAVQDGQLILTPVEPGAWTLATLLARVTPRNLHAEVDVGKRVGREIW